MRDPHARQSLSGLTTTAKALYIVLLWQATERNVVVVVDGNKQAEALGELVDTFFDLLVTSDLPRPQTIPAWTCCPRSACPRTAKSASSAPSACGGMASRKTSITITPVASALLRTEAAEFYRQLALTLRVGEEIPLEDLLAHLESIGYEKRDPVEMVGEYSLRGGILDIFPAEASKPIRIELFGDLIESIRRFDVETQRSVMKVSEATLLPLAEYPKSRELFRELAEQMDVASPGDPFPGWEFAVPLVRPRKHSLFSLTENPLVVVDEPEQVAAASERLWKRLEDKPDQSDSPARRKRISSPGPSCAQSSRRKRRSSRIRELELITNHQSLTSIRVDGVPAVARVSRQHPGRHRRSAQPGGARLSRGRSSRRSNGELERLADIFQEYSVPFQLGLDPADATSPVSRRALLCRRHRRQHVSGQRTGPPRRRLSRSAHRRLRLRRSVRFVRPGRASPAPPNRSSPPSPPTWPI